MNFQRTNGSWFLILIACLDRFVTSGTVYEVYLHHFFFALLAHNRWDSSLGLLWKDALETKEFITLANLTYTWPILLTYFLWYAAIVAVPLKRLELFIPVAALGAFLLQPLITLLPPEISRLSRSVLSSYDTNQSLTSRQPYNHQALPSEAHIRLVRLRGFLLWRDVQILAYPLDACPAYEAISYTWDNQEPTCPIVVNRGRLLVTRNARQIMYDFTPTCGQRIVWIDSICINQAQDDDSLAERTVQVRRMSEIYRRAIAVRVWLSQPSVQETLLPESLDVLSKESLAEWIHAHIVSEVSFPRLHQRIFILIALALRVFYISSLRPSTLSSESLQHIISHNYWIRLWIIQEIVFGQEVTIHLGPMCITWQSLSNFAHTISPEDSRDEYSWGITAWLGLHKFYDISPSDEILRGLRQIKLITQLRSNISNGKFEDLLGLLSLLFHTMARDPRDKIYGLLSLVQERRGGPETCSNIQADYNLATRTLYKGLAERYLTQGAGEFNAKILLYAGVGWPRTVGGLPSWVPDWTSISMAHTRAFATAAFYLHGEASTLSKCQKAFSFQGNTLKIAGCHVIDTISAQTQIIDHDDDSRRWFHEICDVVEGQLSYIPAKEIDFLGEWSWCYRRCPGRWRGAIFRVLIGDIKSYWGEVPAHTKVTKFMRPDTFPNVIPGAGYENPNHANPRGGRIELEASYDEWLKLPHRQPRYPDTVEKEHTGCVSFVSLSRRKTQGLRFAVSQTGRMCLVPPQAALGDKVMISEYLRSPYLIRPMKNEKGYQLVGYCIALGLMGDREWNHHNVAMGVNPEGYNLEVCKKEVLTIY